MSNIVEVLESIQTTRQEFNLPVEPVVTLREQFESAKVILPVIGRFSSGKSALLNTLLGYTRRPILKTDITPETAVPTEIMYSNCGDRVVLFKKDGTTSEITVEAYQQDRFEASAYEKIEIHLEETRFLKTIPDVVLVDMPGFESTFNEHDRAIYEYLPKSLAYILTIPAESMQLTQSMIDIIKELYRNKKPIAIVITKGDMMPDIMNEDTRENDELYRKLKQDLAKYLSMLDTVTFAVTSNLDDDASELEPYLKTIQKEAPRLFYTAFKQPVYNMITQTKAGLISQLNSVGLDESKLEEQAEQAENELAQKTEELENEKAAFQEEISDCVDKIIGRMRQRLNEETDDFVETLEHGGSIESDVNYIAKRVAEQGLEEYFYPIANKYVEQIKIAIENMNIVAGAIDGASGETGIGGNDFVMAASTGIGAETALGGIASSVIGSSLIGSLSIGTFFIPIVGILAGIGTLLYRWSSKKERNRNQIRSQLYAMYPDILNTMETNLRQQIGERVQQVNAIIDKNIDDVRVVLEAALTNARQALRESKEENVNKKIKLEEAVKRLEEDVKRLEEDVKRLEVLTDGV